MKQFLLAPVLAALLSATAMAQPGGGGGGGGGGPGGGGGGEPPGQGPDPEQLLAQAEKYYEALEYEASLKVLVAVQQVPSATPMQKARSFLYMGVCFTALGNAQNAVAAFMELLKIKPAFRLPPGISPSIQAMFKEALKKMKLPENPPPEAQGEPASQAAAGHGPKDTSVSVDATVEGTQKAGQPVDVKIELTDPKRYVRDLVLHWRLVGGPDFSTIRVKYTTGQTKVTGRIPGAVLGQSAGRLQFVVEALGIGGNTLAHAGSHSSPLEAELEAASKGRSKWGWYVLGIGGGAAVVGGIVAAILLTRGKEVIPPQTTANVSVTVR